MTDNTTTSAPLPYSQLPLAEPLLRAVADMGYTHTTPIQAQAIPVVLAGQDVMGAAQTGTGKTAAFSLPLLQRLLKHENASVSPARHPVRALVLLPTRELADQVAQQVKQYAKYTQLRSAVVFGGIDMKPQTAELKAGVEVLVATPGRLLDHIEARSAVLNQVEYVVLDEADRMLDIGFLPDLERILAYLPKQRTTLLFSATFSPEIKRLAASYLHNVKGYNVAVVDCDDPQHSIHGLREHEMGLIDSSTYFKALACDHFRRIKKNAYTIVKSNAVNALDDAERMIATEDVKPDVVFFDMPGTLRSNGVIKTLSQMDYIFTPLSADRFVVESTLKFVTMFRDRLMTTGQAKTKGLHLFWTMVDGRERNDLYGIYEEVIAEMGFPVLSTRLPDSKKFRRDLSEERKSVFRSTIFPMDTALLKGSGIREFSEEISDIIRPQ